MIGCTVAQNATDPAGPQAASSQVATSWVVPASRVAHALVAGLLLGCIAVVYVAAWHGTADTVTLTAVAILCVEGVLVLLSGGDCPLTPLRQRLGDDRPLLELVLPPRAAALAVPVLGVVTALGVVLLAVRTL
jgi:hypothetical protein